MKAILVIDMPKSCDKCIEFDYEYLTCLANRDGLFDEKWNVQRQSWCPLKPYDEDFMKEVANDYRRLK